MDCPRRSGYVTLTAFPSGRLTAAAGKSLCERPPIGAFTAPSVTVLNLSFPPVRQSRYTTKPPLSDSHPVTYLLDMLVVLLISQKDYKPFGVVRWCVCEV